MMKLSKMPFMALVSLFLLSNILFTAYIVSLTPSISVDKPFKETVSTYWRSQDISSKDTIIKSLYPEIQKDFPQLVQTHKFYDTNNKKNQIAGKQAFSELTLRIFSFYQFVKRKNWQTLTRMSYQSLQQYSSALDNYITDGSFNAKKVMRYNNEMKSLTRSSRLKTQDQTVVLSKIDVLNKDLNRVEIYIGEKAALNKIKNEMTPDLSSLANYSKSPAGLTYIDQITDLPFRTIQLLIAQYLVSGIFFFVIMGLYRSKRDFKFHALFEKGDQPYALLNKNGDFLEVNNSLKEVLPFKKFNLIRNLNWSSFEKLASIDLKTPISKIKNTHITSGKFVIGDVSQDFLVRLSPNKKFGGFALNLIPAKEIEMFQDLNALPVFTPPEAKEDVHLSYILEDVIAELSILFQSKQVELNLVLSSKNHVITGNIDKTHIALKTFIRDLVLSLAPKSRTKTFTLTLEDTLDGITLRADMDDVKLASPILKSNFKFEEAGKMKKRNLNQGIEVLKNSGVGFEIDLNFGNNFDINNKFIGSNISIEMRN